MQPDPMLTRVLVLDRYAPSYAEHESIATVTLGDALTKEWSDDRHFVAYAPRTVPLADRPGERIAVRLRQHAEDDDPAVYDVLDQLDTPCVEMTIRVGDIDAPTKPASSEWRTETEARLAQSQIAHYTTRNGYRLIEPLSEPYVIENETDAARWSRDYVEWCGELRELFGLVLDVRCKDWTRIYRLPNVVREGERERSALRGTPRPRTELERAWARAEHVALSAPPSIAGQGGDAALFEARNAIESAIGDAIASEDGADLMASALDVFNTRCEPPWPKAKLKLETKRALAKATTPSASLGRALADRASLRAELGYAPSAPDVEAPPSAVEIASDEWNWHDDLPELDWYCRELGIAASDRKVTIIAGDPGAGKGPLSNYFGACFALGEPIFGQYAVQRCNVGILDFEGLRVSVRRIAQHAVGLGHAKEELDGALFMRDPMPHEMLDIAWIRDWVEARAIKVLIVDSYTSAASGLGLDSNKPEFADLARELGVLGICMILVAHANKASASAARDGAQPSWADIAGNGALVSMAQTAIHMRVPDGEDANSARLVCIRAPEKKFDTLAIRWAPNEDGSAWTCEIDPNATDARRAKAADGELSAWAARGARDRIIQQLENSRTQYREMKRLAVDAGVPVAIAARILSDLLAEGAVKTAMLKGNAAYALA